MHKLVVTVRTLRRADYLKKCLASLEANADLEGVDFYFYQDGGVNPFSGVRYAKDQELADSFDVLIRSKLCNKSIKMNGYNVGSAIQKIEMLTSLFTRYDYVMMLDNDLVVNPFYIKTIKTLFKQFKDDPEAGILHTSYRHHPNTPVESQEVAKKMEDKVAYGFSHRWEQGFWKKSWKKILPHFKPYMEVAQTCDFKQLLSPSPPPEVEEVRKRLVWLYGKPNCDFVLEECAKKAGYKGLHTLALRHRTIGERGIYTHNPKKWTGEGYDKIVIHDIGGKVNEYNLVS